MLGRRSVVGFVVFVSMALIPAAHGQVTRIPVQLSAVASAGPGGGEYFDTATVSGGSNPGGTVTFTLFGPNDDACARAPVFMSVQPVTGQGTEAVTVTSDHVFLTAPGVYHWVASYGGDAVHSPAGPTACLDPNQAVGFGSSSISFSAQASPATTVGGRVWDTFTITTSAVPTGTVTFSLFGPDAAGCTGSPPFTSVTPVNGNGSYRSEGYTPTRPGVYRWVAAYGGDADDPNLFTSCDDPSQRVEVAPAAPAPANARAGPCVVVAQQLRSLRLALAPYVDQSFYEALTAPWSARLGCA